VRIIGGTYRSLKLKRVPSDKTRETADFVREAVFNLLQNHVHGVVLDLFAGSGAYGLEALSRGASYLYAIDFDKDAVQTIFTNVKTLGVMDKVTILQRDYQQFIKTTISTRFNLVFLDPPYTFASFAELLEKVNDLVADHGMVVCETEKKKPMPDRIGDLILYKSRTYGRKQITIYEKQKV